MFKIVVFCFLLTPSLLFAQNKNDFIGQWKVDNISFKLEDSLLQPSEIYELENKYETYYLEKEKNTVFTFYDNDSINIKNEKIQKGTFIIAEEKLIIYNQNKQTKSNYHIKIISPIYIELKTITETLSYSIFIKKITTK